MTLRFLPNTAIQPGVFRTYTDATLADLVANADPDEEPGEATFACHMTYSQVDGRITSVDLEVQLVINMPEWTELNNRPPREQAEWNRFLAALRFHEDGHIAIFRREFPVTFQKLSASTAAGIGGLLEREKQRIQDKSDLYDVRTGHGTKQTGCPQGTTVINVP